MEKGQEKDWGRDEMNLAEFPISLLSNRAPSGYKTVMFTDEVRDKANEQMVARERSQSPGATSTGLLRPLTMTSSWDFSNSLWMH